MAKDQRNVEAITPMEVDFAKWYTDICLKAELVDYASVKGFMILRPYGYAIWENIQRIMDGMFKKTGHVNVAMPVLIPESLLKKEGELVEGFAPEVAWVTMGGSEKLEDRMCVRHGQRAAKTRLHFLKDIGKGLTSVTHLHHGHTRSMIIEQFCLRLCQHLLGEHRRSGGKIECFLSSHENRLRR